MFRVNEGALIALLKAHEGLHDGNKAQPLLQPAICPTGFITCGYGRRLYDKNTGADLKGPEGLEIALEQYGSITERQAEQYLREDIGKFAFAVSKLVRKPVSRNAAAALVSLCYNIGEANFKSSTVLRLVNQGPAHETQAAKAFHMWVKGTVKQNGRKVKVTLPGLVRRRADEAALFLKPDAGTVLDDLGPEVIELAPEKSLAKSREIQAAAAGGGLGLVGVGGLSEVVNVLQEVRSELFGIDLGSLQYAVGALGLVIAACSIASIVIRIRARNKGER